MKKILIIAMLSLVLVGCGSGSSNDINMQSTVQDRIDALIRAENSAIAEEELEEDEHFNELKDVVADVDFTSLNETLLFAQLNNLIYMYPEYLGDTIKVKGFYYADVLPDIDMTYHYILLMDTYNCCQGILEFQLPEGSEYPEIGTELMIFGEYALDVDETGQYPYVAVTKYVI